MNILLSGIVGSTAYGLAGPGSDVDRLGLFAVDTAALHGLHRPTESHVTTAPDRTLHEAAKWCRLALRGNPTVTELVWLPDDLYEVRTPLGDELIELRSSLFPPSASGTPTSATPPSSSSGCTTGVTVPPRQTPASGPQSTPGTSCACATRVSSCTPPAG
ncbi:DNA polymerase beta superfamily protein [Streptomyces sp. SLBN-118]|uniref:DNA polymerase beta superfamily protein n=1 Tax=Streptomyces sp. SLBN-118 TaxID=2768454 RepID=UPI0037D9A3E2